MITKKQTIFPIDFFVYPPLQLRFLDTVYDHRAFKCLVLKSIGLHSRSVSLNPSLN